MATSKKVSDCGTYSFTGLSVQRNEMDQKVAHSNLLVGSTGQCGDGLSALT